jgi:glycerol dehydrogenase-like iron-containing ADH family enzyme
MSDYFAPYNQPAYWLDQAGMKQVRGWMGQKRICPACGREHAVHTRMMEQAPDMALHIGRYLSALGMRGRCVVVMDEHTRQAAGLSLMEGLGVYRPRAVVFTRPDLHADEQALGTLLTELSDRPDFIVSCGSGTLTDITRYNSFMTGIPFVSYATAASVDGFASGSTPLLVKGFKTTYPGVAPEGIFYDPAVLAAAPQKMTAAGFGDVLAKVIALIDWRLAYVAEDEPFCPLIAAMVDRAVKDCLALATDLAAYGQAATIPGAGTAAGQTGAPPAEMERTAAAADGKPQVRRVQVGENGVTVQPAADGAGVRPARVDAANIKREADVLAAKGEACVRLMETLSLTGVAMQMMQTSRPASGSDHQISHLLEMRDIQQHRQGSLHGDKVGIGTLIGMHMYLRLFEGRKMPEQRPTMPADLWREEVRRVYGPLADHALVINPSEPPQGEIWDRQKARLEQAMESYGYDVVDSFKTLLPEARDKIAAMGGPTRPDHLGYSVQDTFDAIAFGKENRPKFTTLRLAERYGWLYDLADEIARGLPEGKIY